MYSTSPQSPQLFQSNCARFNGQSNNMNPIQYCLLRSLKCSKKKALHYVVKPVCRFDTTIKKDGPSSHRIFSVTKDDYLVYNGWKQIKPELSYQNQRMVSMTKITQDQNTIDLNHSEDAEYLENHFNENDNRTIQQNNDIQKKWNINKNVTVQQIRLLRQTSKEIHRKATQFHLKSQKFTALSDIIFKDRVELLKSQKSHSPIIKLDLFNNLSQVPELKLAQIFKFTTQKEQKKQVIKSKLSRNQTLQDENSRLSSGQKTQNTIERQVSYRLKKETDYYDLLQDDTIVENKLSVINQIKTILKNGYQYDEQGQIRPSSNKARNAPIKQQKDSMVYQNFQQQQHKTYEKKIIQDHINFTNSRISKDTQVKSGELCLENLQELITQREKSLQKATVRMNRTQSHPILQDSQQILKNSPLFINHTRGFGVNKLSKKKDSKYTLQSLASDRTSTYRTNYTKSQYMLR